MGFLVEFCVGNFPFSALLPGYSRHLSPEVTVIDNPTLKPSSLSPRGQLGRVPVPVVVRHPSRPRRHAGQHVPEANPEGRRQEGVQDRVDAGVAVGQDV